MPVQNETLEQRLKAQAAQLGFAACAIARADAAPRTAERLRQWLEAGHHGDMLWMEERAEQRGSPTGLWPEARSVIMLGMSYAPGRDPLALAEVGDRGRISVYAQGRDYHDVVKKALKALARWLVDQQPTALKVFVDTAPVMEKPLAQGAGLGWQGKHSNLVSRQHGSWLFLGAIYTEIALEPDAPEVDHCGSCTACLSSCPTDAFPAPYIVDARRCISYLTIEHKGPIPEEFRARMGNRIYGCDDCLAACPWNKFAAAARDIGYQPRVGAPELAELVREGRRNEFAAFSAFADPHKREQIPDPNAEKTFHASQPRLIGHGSEKQQETLALYQKLLQFRHQYIIPHLSGTQALGAHMLGYGAVSARWRLGNGSELRIDLNLSDTPVVNPPQTEAVWLFQQPSSVDLSESGELPAYCALVSLTAATPLQPLDGERL